MKSDGDQPAGHGVAPGILNSMIVRRVLFVASSIGIFATGSLAVLSVWDVISSETAWRAFATFIIALLSLGFFAITNEVFGGRTK